MLQTAHILNVLNVADQEYTNAQIYWALPFQIIYEKVRTNASIDSYKEVFECRRHPLSNYGDVLDLRNRPGLILSLLRPPLRNNTN
jgi:hypothetical protein